MEEIDYSDSAFDESMRVFYITLSTVRPTVVVSGDQPVPIPAKQLSWTAVASHNHHYFFLSFSFFTLSRAIASETVAEEPDFQGANNKRFFSFFLFQTMSYAQTSGGGNPGTQKWGRGT